jgi:hypothetical protein
LPEPQVNEARDVIARVATHPRRLAGDRRMLVGAADSYAGTIARRDSDDRIVAEVVARREAAAWQKRSRGPGQPGRSRFAQGGLRGSLPLYPLRAMEGESKTGPSERSRLTPVLRSGRYDPIREKFLLALLFLYLSAHAALKWGRAAGVPAGMISFAESLATGF